MNTVRRSAFLLALAAAAGLAACASSHGSSDASATASAAADATTPSVADATAAAAAQSNPYPDWAAAIAPDYPNRIEQSAIGPFYQIDTGDAPATVVAWYKAHTTGGTWKSLDPDAAPEWIYNTPDGGQLQIQQNTYPGNNPAAKAVKTMIAITHKKH